MRDWTHLNRGPEFKRPAFHSGFPDSLSVCNDLALCLHLISSTRNAEEKAENNAPKCVRE